jgi:hypothetical protein
VQVGVGPPFFSSYSQLADDSTQQNQNLHPVDSDKVTQRERQERLDKFLGKIVILLTRQMMGV